MSRNTLRIAAILGAVGLAGLGLTVAAFGGVGGAASFLRAHFAHSAHGHGHGHGHGHSAGFLADLELSDEQHRHLEFIHDIFGSQHGVSERVHEELMRWTVDRIERNELSAEEVRELIDQHLEQLRVLAYQVSDEAVAFADSLDDEQRRLLVEHLRRVQIHGHGHGHGH